MGSDISSLVFTVQNLRSWLQNSKEITITFYLKAAGSHSDLLIYKTAGGNYGLSLKLLGNYES